MTNPMPTFEILRNRVFVETISAVSLKQAVKRARSMYGRCEVIACNIARHADAHIGPDGHRTEGRAPCNRSAAAKAKLAAIRAAEIAAWKENQAA